MDNIIQKINALKFLQAKCFENTVSDYLATLLIIVVGIAILALLKFFVMRRLEKAAKASKHTIDDFIVKMVKKSVIPALYVGVIFLSVHHLALGDTVSKAIDVITIVILTLLGVRFVVPIINYAIMHYLVGATDDEAQQRNIKVIMPVIRFAIYGIALFFLLDNLGIKITTLVAGLGIGGVAVALACQAMLGDLFNYFAILFDRPFELGDFIIVGDCLGTVEHIGIKTTRLRSLGGEQLVFSNTDLTGSRVKNYKRMQKRRVLFKIGVVYGTSAEHLKAMPGMIREIVEGVEGTTFDRAHFSSYGDFSLDFEIVYYVLSSDYNRYMDIQQQINLGMFEEFGKRSIEFAFPTQTLYMEKY